ncbi:FG-GAP repeat protein [Hydrogenophaga sp. BPS33]|uniref:FG-GAP repeat protein n=1 Tax=Hydrogenophaga sp. BPS33 TaxID=2651974 RepID=UPI0013577A19|nr:FG-GAP repeat protein [Hydrogenophaga sp. BPS33]
MPAILFNPTCTMPSSLQKFCLVMAAVLLTAVALPGCGGSDLSVNTDGLPTIGSMPDSPDITVALNYIKSSSPNPVMLGHSVALSANGETLAIGARTDSSDGSDPANESLPNSGAVYVFIRDGNTWKLQDYLKASNRDDGDEFGSSVALSATGDTLAVGAIGEDSMALSLGGGESDNSAGAAGAAYVFQRSAGSWTQQAYLKAENANVADAFGISVALSGNGDRLAVGSQNEDSNGLDPANGDVDEAGAVYVFSRNNVAHSWTQSAFIKASNVGLGDFFGISLALSNDGDTLAVGAINEASDGIAGPDDDSLTGAGAAYVFSRDALDRWTEIAYLKASNAGRDDQFGHSLALSGDGKTLAVGAHREQGNGTNPADDSLLDAGAAYVFTRDAADHWTQAAYLKASNAGDGDQFGYSMALSLHGDLLAVGARWEASSARGVNGDQNDNAFGESGAVYLFSRSSGDHWAQRAYLKASNPDVGDSFGFSVALPSDGLTLAVGAPHEESAATGVNGDQSDNGRSRAGAVYALNITLN